MKKNIFKLLILFLISFSFSFFYPNSSDVIAVNMCSDYRGWVIYKPVWGTLSGNDCGFIKKGGSGIGPGQYGDPICIGACTFKVSYCTSINDNIEGSDSSGNPVVAHQAGCEVTYSGKNCDQAPPECNKPDAGPASDIGNIFGKIDPPDAIKNFGFGSIGISNFLSNLVALIFSLVMIVFVFMLLWGAFDWIMSEGDKEKIASARSKIINAIIGIILFAIAFAVIRLIGAFTGFTFFK